MQGTYINFLNLKKFLHFYFINQRTYNPFQNFQILTLKIDDFQVGAITTIVFYF